MIFISFLSTRGFKTGVDDFNKLTPCVILALTKMSISDLRLSGIFFLLLRKRYSLLIFEYGRHVFRLRMLHMPG